MLACLLVLSFVAMNVWLLRLMMGLNLEPLFWLAVSIGLTFWPVSRPEIALFPSTID